MFANMKSSKSYRWLIPTTLQWSLHQS